MKKNFARLFKIANTESLSAGFTLIELLVAMSLTLIVTSISGFGLVAMMTSNNKAETKIQRRAELNRALDFIADEARMASSVSNTAPTWATSNWINNLGGGSPNAKFFIQIPLKVESMIPGNPAVTVKNHGFSDGNAVMFTGPGTVSSPLLKNTIYYVRDATLNINTFNVSILPGQTAISLTNASSGNLTANQLLVYYIRDSVNNNTWLPPRTINRSAGPCSPPTYPESNCDHS